MPVTLDERPVFIIGSERSGTTLVMAVLAAHPRLAVPEVTWYYPRFRPYLHTYGDLAARANFETLANEMAHGLRVPYWRMPDVDPATFGDEIAACAAEIEPSFAGVFAAMFERYCRHAGKPRWGEKTPGNVGYVGRILEDFPNAQFVYIYRDCRDASAEFLNSQFGPCNAYCAALAWNDGQRAVKPFRESLGADQWFDLKYENFVHDPIAQSRAVCAFLGEDYDDAMMAFHTTPQAQRRGQTRDNAALGHPISDRYVGRYKYELSLEQQEIMAWAAGDMMAELGYDEIAKPKALSDDEVALAIEMDGRYRAATLDAPHGWVVFESYGDWLIDQRAARRRAGLWSSHPDPAPYPIGRPREELLAGMRAERKWKDHFAVKRSSASDKSVL